MPGFAHPSFWGAKVAGKNGLDSRAFACGCQADWQHWLGFAHLRHPALSFSHPFPMCLHACLLLNITLVGIAPWVVNEKRSCLCRCRGLSGMALKNDICVLPTWWLCDAALGVAVGKYHLCAASKAAWEIYECHVCVWLPHGCLGRHHMSALPVPRVAMLSSVFQMISFQMFGYHER